MIIHKCDKCGKTAEQSKGEPNRNLPKSWYALVHGQSSFCRTVRYDLCNECRVKLEIPEDYNKSEPYVGDQLIGLIEQIVQEEMESH